MEPVIYRIKVPLKKKDEEFIHLQELIEKKRNSLMIKQQNLQVISKQNHFLEEVQKDYAKYYNFIVQQKRDQIKALELLNNYISDLTKSNNLTKHNIEDATEEQKKIMQEIKSIQNGLDSLISGFDNRI